MGPVGDTGPMGISGEGGAPGDQGPEGPNYMTLDDVCDNANETDQDIHTSGSLRASDIKLNTELEDSDIVIQFYFPR